MPKVIARLEEETTPFAAATVGKVVAVDSDGTLLVRIPGAGLEPRAAKVSGSMLRSRDHLPGKEVLIVFENGDPALPIACDTVHGRLSPSVEEAQSATESLKPEEVVIDGERIIFDAKKEIVLRCGDSTLTLTADGKIVVRGSDLLSRSSGPVRIRGAYLLLN